MPALTANRRTLAPLAMVTAAAFVFALLLLLVRLRWAPLESADRGAATWLNSLVAGHSMVAGIVKAVTWLGSGGVLWTLTGAAAVVLALRRRWRLALYLLVTGAGALVLDPVLKDLVGRLRPVVAHPVAYGNGNSFPSGHALDSLVCYGALFLVFLPAARGAWRRVLTAVIVTVIVAIGVSRVLLGVHYVSDVLGGWALGVAWLGITAFAFELSRQVTGDPVTDPVTEGLEPEARRDLMPAEPERATHLERRYDRARAYGRTAAGVAVAWVLIAGVITGIGKLVMMTGNGNPLGDHAIPHWFAAQRTAALNHWRLVASNLAILVIGHARGRWRCLFLIPAILMPVLIAIARMYRGEHHPTDILASVLFAALWLTAATLPIKPNKDGLDHASRRPLGLPRLGSAEEIVSVG